MAVPNRSVDPPTELSVELAETFRSQRKRLWNLAYRMTGSGEDADDVVQTAFMRLAERSEAERVESPSAWLWRVATNESLDLLRKRRRRRYEGPWLPAPVGSSALELEPGIRASDSEGHAIRSNPERRYELAESASYAYLLALEALGPRQRAVLLLRDVFDRSAEETASILGTTAGNVRVLHLRARRLLAPYDRERRPPSPELALRHREALARFLACLKADDVAALEALLSEDVCTLTDAGGEYTALPRPLAGRTAVARFYRMANAHRREGGLVERFTEVNGLWAVWITLDRPVRKQAPKSLVRVDLGGDGRIRAIHAILAPRKLAHVDLADGDRTRPS